MQTPPILITTDLRSWMSDGGTILQCTTCKATETEEQTHEDPLMWSHSGTDIDPDHIHCDSCTEAIRG